MYRKKVSLRFRKGNEMNLQSFKRTPESLK